MSFLSSDERARLRAHLLSTGLCGDTRTPRASVVGNAEKLAAGDPDKGLGLGNGGLDAAGVMVAVAALCGCSPDLGRRDGPGVIDPDRTIAALEVAASRLAAAAAARERVLVCTGHPTGVLAMYQRITRALQDAGATILTPAENTRLGSDDAGGRFTRVRYLDGVAVATDSVNIYHTHESWPAERLLDALDAPPGVVLADHGFAGAAIARGIECIAFTDVNDPAIAVARHQGLVAAVVPLDDNRPPAEYAPIGEMLERAIRGAGSGRLAAAPGGV